VLAMPFDKVVKRGELRTLTPKVAQMYATSGDRMLARDLNRLLAMNLIRRTPSGYIANTERLKAFLPPMADPA